MQGHRWLCIASGANARITIGRDLAADKVCEFKNGGRWSLIMHAPNGDNYANENVFAEIEPPRKVVVQHASEAKFRLTIMLASSSAGTVVSWSQTFESSEVASRLEHIVVPANEQNLEQTSGSHFNC
ncbi:MAG: SRPBCC domain-containing protein [Thermoguttaceae bacterium]